MARQRSYTFWIMYGAFHAAMAAAGLLIPALMLVWIFGVNEVFSQLMILCGLVSVRCMIDFAKYIAQGSPLKNELTDDAESIVELALMWSVLAMAIIWITGVDDPATRAAIWYWPVGAFATFIFGARMLLGFATEFWIRSLSSQRDVRNLMKTGFGRAH